MVLMAAIPTPMATLTIISAVIFMHSPKDFTNADTGALDKQKIEDVVGKLVSINHDLQAEDESAQTETWQVGEGKGLVCRTGTVWYGGGQSQHEGRGF